MRIAFGHVTPLLAAGAAAVALAVAPVAAAANQQSCSNTSGSTKCQKIGDVEINSSIPAPYAGPWGIYGPFWGG
jgi:hypothetical protein